MLVGIFVALLVGVALGVALARRIPERTDDDTLAGEMTDLLSVNGPTETDRDESVAALYQAADQLDMALVVCDAAGSIVYRNASSIAMRSTITGVIVGEHVDVALDAGLAGRRTDKRIDLHGPPRVSLELLAEPLENGGAAASVKDVSESVRIDTMRTDFVANISHELKTPVGAVAVLADALDGETDPEVIARVSQMIVEESHRAVTTIDDLLELSRIESARPADDLVDLGDVVRAAVARGRAVQPGADVDITGFDTSETVVIRADERQLTSAVGNLVENAVKYSDRSGVVQVRTRVSERHVEVMVSDQGVGIPQRDLGRIFERFYRVDRARSRETGGTGLGLSIVRHVATNHGGDVLVESHEGEGSTFVLRLPVTLVVDCGTAAAGDVESDRERISHE